MKKRSINIGESDFRSYMANLCDIFQLFREDAPKVTRIDIYSNGIRLFDQDDHQVKSFSVQAIKQAQEAFNATFND